jgi:hypothetical protein
MTREERKEAKQKQEAAGYVRARASIIMAALRAESIVSLRVAVKAALDTVKREIWSLAGDTREAVQKHVQAALAATDYRLDKAESTDLGVEKHRLGRLLSLAPTKE